MWDGLTADEDAAVEGCLRGSRAGTNVALASATMYCGLNYDTLSMLYGMMG